MDLAAAYEQKLPLEAASVAVEADAFVVVVDFEAVSTRDGDEALLFDLQVHPKDKISSHSGLLKYTIKDYVSCFCPFLKTTVPNAAHLMVFLFFSL